MRHAASLLNVPLKWRLASDLRLGAGEMTQAPVQFDVFTDLRAAFGLRQSHFPVAAWPRLAEG
jgi:hypothetical protein